MMLRPLLKIMKQEMPGFCHSVSCTEMAEEIQMNLKKLPKGKLVSINTDGKNHDGHQHWSIIEAIDVFFFRKLMKTGWVPNTLRKYVYNIDNVLSVICIPLFERTSKLKVAFSKSIKAIF